MTENIDKVFLRSDYTSNSLYDGRSGALLVLFQLYKFSNNELLLGYINEFLKTILECARWSDRGLYWQYPGYSDCESQGFAYGNAGIIYVLKLINQALPSDVLQFVIAEVIEFRSCDENREGNHPEAILKETENSHGDFLAMVFENREKVRFKESGIFSWGFGMMGEILSNPVVSVADIKKILEHLVKTVGNSSISHDLYYSDDKFDFLLLSTKLSLLSEQDQKIINEEVEKRFITLEVEKTIWSSASVLRDLCLLLSVSRKDNSGNVYFPFIDDFSDTSQTDFPAFHYVSLEITLVDLREKLLSRYLYRTIELLKGIDTKALDTFFRHYERENSGQEIMRFCNYIDKLNEGSGSLHYQDQLNDVFEFERSKFVFFSPVLVRSPQNFILFFNYRKGVLQLLNRPEAYLLDLKFCVSEHAVIRKTRWNWALISGHLETDKQLVSNIYLENLHKSPESYEYVFHSSILWESIESAISPAHALLLNCFDRPKTLRQTRDEMLYYIKSLPVETLNALLHQIGSSSLKHIQGMDFYDVINEVICNTVKEWVYFRILECCD